LASPCADLVVPARNVRYEATLWRQARQILLALDALDRHKAQARKNAALLGR
jgi:hypothetical protein